MINISQELCEDMTTAAFLRALNRMINRKGCPATIYSDNARTYKSSSKIINSLFEDPKRRKGIEKKTFDHNIEWRFITERAPWHGGFYERLVQSVKVPLRKILKNTRLSHIELATVLTDIEGQLNSRPLCKLSDDVQNLLPLTPAHLLLGRSLQQLPECNLDEKEYHLQSSGDTGINYRKRFGIAGQRNICYN